MALAAGESITLALHALGDLPDSSSVRALIVAAVASPSTALLDQLELVLITETGTLPERVQEMNTPDPAGMLNAIMNAYRAIMTWITSTRARINVQNASGNYPRTGEATRRSAIVSASGQYNANSSYWRGVPGECGPEIMP